MTELLKEDGETDVKAIVLQGTLTDSNAIARGNAWSDVEKETGAWETVEWVPTDWEAEKFKSGLANALAANPDVNLIYCESDFAFNSVEAALEECDRYIRLVMKNMCIWLQMTYSHRDIRDSWTNILIVELPTMHGTRQWQ